MLVRTVLWYSAQTVSGAYFECAKDMFRDSGHTRNGISELVHPRTFPGSPVIPPLPLPTPTRIPSIHRLLSLEGTLSRISRNWNCPGRICLAFFLWHHNPELPPCRSVGQHSVPSRGRGGLCVGGHR